MPRRQKLRFHAIAVLSLACCGNAAAQWKPERQAEIIVTAAEGGNQDLTARLIQSIWQTRKIVYPTVITNKPGGGGAIAAAYLNQHARDPHYLMMLAPTLLTSRIMGTNSFQFSDCTPLAMLFNEYIFVSVKADSPIKTGRDMIQRLRQAPDSMSIAIATAIGNHIHMGVALPMKAAGVDIKRMKVVAFKSSAQSLTALLGGHVDAAASTFAALSPYVAAGSLRIVGMSAAQRMPGSLANIPTWKEQGANAVFDSWRGVVGAKDLTNAQVKFWDAAFTALSQSAEWRADAEKNYNVIHYLNSADTRRYWEEQYGELEAALTELGLARRGK
ncbi:MAG: tripartite tricarboxylate transporter substrate-binding protein [Betaproteobacteria bacterium]